MGFFRKKPVLIEARRWDGTLVDAVRILAWIKDADPELRGSSYRAGTGRDCPPELHIATLEDGRNGIARHIASSGDWIVKDLKGRFYPCKPDIFADTYEEE